MSRDPVRVFYYPEYDMESLTLKKAILFFDEIHLMDRPSFKITDHFGTIGCVSPLRPFAADLNARGMPFFIHEVTGGSVPDRVYDSMVGDLSDMEFLLQYQRGLKESELFRIMQVPPANYGENGTNVEIANKLVALDLQSGLKSYNSVRDILVDTDVKWFDTATLEATTKYFVAEAAVTSLKMNFALDLCSQNGFIPFADSEPYSWFLGRKYARAVDRISAAGRPGQITDLSFAVFDELVDGDRLERLEFGEVIRLRRESSSAREEFLEYLAALQAKQGEIGLAEDYERCIRRLVQTDIVPAARQYRQKLAKINDEIYGALVKGVVTALGGGSALSLFGDLSLPKIVAAAGVGGVLVGNVAVDAIVQGRAATRECAISYVLKFP